MLLRTSAFPGCQWQQNVWPYPPTSAKKAQKKKKGIASSQRKQGSSTCLAGMQPSAEWSAPTSVKSGYFPTLLDSVSISWWHFLHGWQVCCSWLWDVTSRAQLWAGSSEHTILTSSHSKHSGKFPSFEKELPVAPGRAPIKTQEFCSRLSNYKTGNTSIMCILYKKEGEMYSISQTFWGLIARSLAKMQWHKTESSGSQKHKNLQNHPQHRNGTQIMHFPEEKLQREYINILMLPTCFLFRKKKAINMTF